MSGSNSLGGPPDGELIISAAGQTFSGWTGVSVTRTVEGMPARFNVRGTKKLPGELRGPIPINSPCTISIGGHTVRAISPDTSSGGATGAAPASPAVKQSAPNAGTDGRRDL